MISLHHNVVLTQGLPGEILENLLKSEDNQGENRAPELWVSLDISALYAVPRSTRFRAVRGSV